jgi:4-aminobutyrate aminotransferase-like enzyme
LFVNSGSEANDTAWRFAKEVTGNAGAIVTEFAYHGVTVASAELSPEEWPDGYRPPNVATIPAPDGFRGAHRSSEDGWARRYSASVAEALAMLDSSGHSLSVTCIDGSFASDGIFTPPPEYLQDVVRRTHEAGGLYIADEVQAGFGRSGDHLWNFAASDIAPDFVTLGKPMGNGHPVGAVVTRAEIAERFAKRYPEFFSTFGGNTVAATVALAVLDVIEDEGLQINAAAIGAYVRSGLADLSGRHTAIGDIRGSGLMIGVELIADSSTMEPATALAGTVLNGMRDKGVLIGTTGPQSNVLKIRPPLVFNQANADQLIETLDAVLSEAGAT